MPNFRKLVNRMDAVCMKLLGDGFAIYDNKCKVQVKIDLNVEQFGGFDTQGTARRHEVEVFVSEVPDAKRGHTLETDDGKFVFDGQISNDGHISRWHINES